MTDNAWPWPDPWRASAVAFDAWIAPWGPVAGLQARRAQRLAALLTAAHGAALYRERFARHGTRFEAQPALSKTELMSRFDDSLTDRSISLAALRQFIADPANIGQPFAGRYAVWESSGSSGVPGIFVQDPEAMVVYDALEAWRRPASAGTRQWSDPFYARERIAFVGAIDGHFASTVMQARLQQLLPGDAGRWARFSLLQPLSALVRALQQWQPTLLATYPSAALMLADEAAAGRLRLSLRELLTGGEALGETARTTLMARFDCPVHASYGASECMTIASECDQRRLHLHADWVILEPVDRDGTPLPEGHTGHTTLLTNLANHVQPLIRYDLGDRVRIEPRRCNCGSVLPVIEVQGRVDDALRLMPPHGAAVRLPPLALTTVLEDQAGVWDFQLVQQGPRCLRLSVAPGSDAQAPARARTALGAYLQAQGLEGVTLEVCRAAPAVQARSGKRPRVVCAHGTGAARPGARRPR